MTLNLGPERLPSTPESAPAGRFAAPGKDRKKREKDDPDSLLMRGVFVPTEDE